MNRWPYRLRAFLRQAILAAFLFGSASAGVPSANAYASADWCGSWRIVHSPTPGSADAVLRGVATVSKNDAWAVGDGYVTKDGGSQIIAAGIIEHWNGRRWSVIPSPEPGTYENHLYAVAALSADNAWAVGADQVAYKGTYPFDTLIEHWDGLRWSVVPSPNSGTEFNFLNAIMAISPSDIWAVGTYQNQGRIAQKNLIEHWDGARWRLVPSPNPGSVINELNGVMAFSSNDVWVVGDYANRIGGNRTLVERWHDAQWSVVKSPNFGPFANYLRAIAGASTYDIWAVGFNWEAPGDITATLTEHWDGTQWSYVYSPDPPGGDNFLGGVIALAANNVLVVGDSVRGTLIERWQGKQWGFVPSPGSGFLDSIAALNQYNIWAVGATSKKVLIEHYC